MIRLMVTGMASGSGKTICTCALLQVLKSRGLKVSAFKCGPDYIDPMFHREVLGIPGHNLDLFLASPERVREIFDVNTRGMDAGICEGVMGYYDGVGGDSERAGAYHVCRTVGMKSLLVLTPKGSSYTLCALIKGILDFRTPNLVGGIVINSVSRERYEKLAPVIEKETGVPVLGYLEKMPEAEIKSRHLGLMTAGEIGDLRNRIEIIGEKSERTLKVDKILEIFEAEAASETEPFESASPVFSPEKAPVIAVAKDEAFCFCYQETLECFEKLGAKLSFFSPIRDKKLPENTGGLYLPGGYPELYARELSENRELMTEIRDKVNAGLPTVAECGGFMYLSKSLTTKEGETYPMAGVFPGEGYPTKGLRRFGYATLKAKEDSLLFRAGEEIPIHEFHHFDLTDAGKDFVTKKNPSGPEIPCGFGGESLYAAYPHLYFEGGEKLALRFIKKAWEYAERKE